MNRAVRANLRSLGFTSREIDAIAEEQKEWASRDAPKALSSAALKQRRYRARKAAEKNATKIPGWSRRRAV